MLDTQKILDVYADLMFAIKQRHAVLLNLLTTTTPLPIWATTELIELQVRLISETFAVACLVAHGDMDGTQTRRLTDAYQADFIINALERLHPNFYPRPSHQIIQDGKVVSWSQVTDGYLTKSELIKRYRETGESLHGGDLRSVLSRQQKQFDPNATLQWANKLVALLNHHHIFLADPPEVEPLGYDAQGIRIPRRQIVVLLHPEGDGRPRAHMFQAHVTPSAS